MSVSNLSEKFSRILQLLIVMHNCRCRSSIEFHFNHSQALYFLVSGDELLGTGFGDRGGTMEAQKNLVGLPLFGLRDGREDGETQPIGRRDVPLLLLGNDSRLVPALVVMGPLRTPLAQVKNSSS